MSARMETTRREVLAAGAGALVLASATARALAGDDAVVPFSYRASDEALADLRRRLAQTRWPERQTGPAWEQGPPLAKLDGATKQAPLLVGPHVAHGGPGPLRQLVDPVLGHRWHPWHPRRPSPPSGGAAPAPVDAVVPGNTGAASLRHAGRQTPAARRDGQAPPDPPTGMHGDAGARHSPTSGGHGVRRPQPLNHSAHCAIG